MSLSVKFLEGKRFEVTSRTHKIIIDQPESEGGTDLGVTPIELLNASLASCAAFYALSFLERRIPDLTRLEVKCKWHYSEAPHRVGTIDLTLVLPYTLTDSTRKGLLRTVEYCTVKNTLKLVPKIRIDLIEGR